MSHTSETALKDLVKDKPKVERGFYTAIQRVFYPDHYVSVKSVESRLINLCLLLCTKGLQFVYSQHRTQEKSCSQTTYCSNIVLKCMVVNKIGPEVINNGHIL